MLQSEALHESRPGTADVPYRLSVCQSTLKGSLDNPGIILGQKVLAQPDCSQRYQDKKRSSAKNGIIQFFT